MSPSPGLTQGGENIGLRGGLEREVELHQEIGEEEEKGPDHVECRECEQEGQAEARYWPEMAGETLADWLHQQIEVPSDDSDDEEIESE